MNVMDDNNEPSDHHELAGAPHNWDGKKPTRSQKRYSDYLYSDSGMTFIEWLKQRKEVP